MSGCGTEWEPSQETYVKSTENGTIFVPKGTMPINGYNVKEFDYKGHHYLMIDAAGPRFAVVLCDPIPEAKHE